MLRWISLVPPSIVFATERRYMYFTRPFSGTYLSGRCASVELAVEAEQLHRRPVGTLVHFRAEELGCRSLMAGRTPSFAWMETIL